MMRPLGEHGVFLLAIRGRYRRTTQEEEFARLYHIPIAKQTDLPISYNITPGQKTAKKLACDIR